MKVDVEKPAGRNSAGIFRKNLSTGKKFKHIVNVKVISESEEDLNDKQKYHKRNKENKKELPTY